MTGIRWVRVAKIGGLTIVLALVLVGQIEAYHGMPLYWYGSLDDGNLGRPTAFAESWRRPEWMPTRVRQDWPGVALQYYAPGTRVQLTVVGLPEWASSWPELAGVVGNSTLAYVADRPGDSDYGDAWRLVFARLAPLWVGKVYVEVKIVE